MGNKGTFIANENVCKPMPNSKIEAQLNLQEMINTNGCGDTLNAGTICGLLEGMEFENAVRLGMDAANMTLRSQHAISHSLKRNKIGNFKRSKI